VAGPGLDIDTALVVPCYNEAGRFPSARFQEFLGECPDLALVLVDDGSTDSTPQRLQELAGVAPDRVHLLTLPANRGKAEAVRAGLLRALELDVAAVGYWDADLATPLEAVSEFRAVLAERPQVELVMGARVVLLGRQIERRPLRHYVGRAAATAIALVLGLRVYDTQCGAKLLRVTPELGAILEQPFEARWIFDVELLARLVAVRGRAGAAEAIYELPLTVWADVAGSKVAAGDYLSAVRDLLRIRRRYFSSGGGPGALPRG